MKARKICRFMLTLLLVLSVLTLTPATEGTVYAAAKVKVTFNSQGGSSVPAKSVSAGAKIGALRTPTNKNFTFKGWYTKPTGGTKITKNTKVKKNTTYYARWGIKKGYVQATFKAFDYYIYKAYKKNAALGSAATKKVTRAGYAFKGWYTKASGGAKIGKNTKIKKNTTYYAQWKTGATPMPTSPNTGTTPKPTSANTTPKPTPTDTGTTPKPTPTNTGATPKPTPTNTGATPKPTPTNTGATPKPTPTPTQAVSPTGVTLVLKSGKLHMPVTGGTCTLAATITPSGANTNTAITWSSSKTGVATVDQYGKVMAKGVGQAIITATTANGKTASMDVIVAADVQSITYTMDGSIGVFLSESNEYTPEMYIRIGETVALPAPKLEPPNAYASLTYALARPSDADKLDIFQDKNGQWCARGKAVTCSLIAATTHNGKVDTFYLFVSEPLTQLSLVDTMAPTSSRSVDVGAFNNLNVYANAGSYPRGYTIESSNPSVMQIESWGTSGVIIGANAGRLFGGRAKAPGTATLTVKFPDGKPAHVCSVTVPKPAPTAYPGLTYYKATYASDGKAKLELNITPVSGATGYTITQHSGANGSGSVLGTWTFTSSQAAKPVTLNNISTGLNHFKVTAATGDANNGNSGTLSTAVLYHPRWVGGRNAEGDGFVMANSLAMPFFMPDILTYSYLNSYLFLMPVDPYAIMLSFDKITGASGYDVFASGAATGSLLITQPSGTRVKEETGFVLNSSETPTIFTIMPYVMSANTKLYGEARTVKFHVNTGKWGNMGYYYHDNNGSVGDPLLEFLFN